jgi:hypothetical protein
MDRRHFFQLMALGTMGLKLGPSQIAHAYDNHLSQHKFKRSYFINFYGEGTYDQSVRIYDIASEKLIKIPIDFPPHTITRISENIIVCTQKYGPNAVMIDIAKEKIALSHTYGPKDYRQYMGHCLFDEGKGVLYTTEQIFTERIDSHHRKGLVSMRDPHTFKVLETYESFGYSPHDLLFTDEGEIALCNTADKDMPYDKAEFWNEEFRNVAFINPQDFSLIRRVKMPNNFFCPGHIKKFSSGLIVTGVYGHLPDLEFQWQETNWNPVVIDKEYKTKELLQDSYIHEKMNTEHLSIAVNENAGVVAVTIPRCDSVNFWSLKDYSFLGHLKFTLPVGILVHPERGDFMVVTDRGVHRINPTNLTSSAMGMYFMGNDMSHSYIV